MKKNFTLGIVIIVIGLIWLLSNLNLIPFSVIDIFFRALSKLWPLLVIGLGVHLVLKDNKTIKAVTWLIIIVAILIYGIYGYYGFLGLG